MSIGSGFEKYGPLYAPPKDAGGGVIQSSFLDSKENVLGEHPYVLVDQWEADASSRDLGKMKDFVRKMELWKQSDPRVVLPANPTPEQKATVQAIDNLVTRVKNMVQAQEQREKQQKLVDEQERLSKEQKAEKDAKKEKERTPRNSFEQALKSWGFSEKYDKYLARYHFEDKEEIKKGIELKKSFMFTRLFNELLAPIDWSTPTLGNPSTALHFVADASYHAKELFLSIDENVSPEDKPHAEGFKKEMGAMLGVLTEMLTMFTQIKAPTGELRTQQSASKMKEIYQAMTTFCNIDRLAVFDMYPKLMDREGNLSKRSVGDLFFLAVADAIEAGHDWNEDVNTGWVREQQYGWEPKTPDKNGKNWVLFVAPGSKKKVILYSPMYSGREYSVPVGVKKNISVFPENEAGSAANEKTDALKKLRRDRIAKLEPNERLQELAGDTAGVLMYQLLVNWGEADAQDMIGTLDSSKPNDNRGRPVGWSYLGRVENSGIYAQKTSDPNSVDSKVNPFIVGRMMQAGVSYTRFMATVEGKTLAQAIVTLARKARKAEEKKDPQKKEPELEGLWGILYSQMEKIPTDKEPVPYVTERGSLAYSNHMVRAITEYSLAESIKEGGLFDIATIDFKEGQVKIKAEVMQQLFDRVRNALEYHEGTDLVASGILANAQEAILDAFNKGSTDENSKEFLARRLPSEEFWEILVVDEDCDIQQATQNPNGYNFEKHALEGSDSRYITRFPTHYVVTPIRLAAWLQDKKRDEKNGGDKRAYKNAVAFHRPVLKEGQPTGQKDKVILIQVQDKKAILSKEKDGNKTLNTNKAKELVQRLHVEYVLEMAGLPGDTISKLKKEDWLPLGLFFSNEMRKKYQAGHYGKFSDRARGVIGERIKAHTGYDMEFIMREDSGIQGRNLLSESQFTEMLALLGFRITLEDWLNTANVFNKLAGLPETPNPAAKKH